jgi:anthranilate synthase component 2
MLGICLGHQSIGQAYGAKIIGCKEIMHGKIKKIKHYKHPLFENINRNFNATRYHSLIVEKKTLPPNLKIIAETDNKIIMGIAHRKKNIYGLQFHPESIGTEVGKLILKNFLNLIKYEY